MGSFVFRWPHAANDVHVTGTFDDWGKTEKLEKVGDVFEKEVQLPSAEEKYYYKFVIDDRDWITDHEAPQEEDGHNNVNNVLLPENIKRTPTTHTTEEAAGETAGGLAAGGLGAAVLSSAHPESTTADLAGGVPIEEKAVETEKSATGVPESHEPFHSPPGTAEATTTDSTAPTSHEALEEDAGAAADGAADLAGAGVDAHEHDEPKAAEPEESTFSVKPIPASSGIGNPISLPAGEKLPEQSEVTPHTVESTATTSKEDYERDASAAVLGGGAAVGLTGVAAHEETKPEADSAFSVPEKSKNMIPESSLPMGGTTKDTMDAGPTISSAAPESTSAFMAGTVPLEPKRQAIVVDEDEMPSATLSEPAPAVPEMVKESLAEAHQDPEAAASPEAVQEKTEVEKQFMEKVKSTDAAGESAPTATAATSETAPTSTSKTGAEAAVEGITAAEAAVAGTTMAAEDKEAPIANGTKDTEATTAPAPETTAPETTAAETTAAETTAAETTAAETTAPETTAVKTTAVETTAPETTALTAKAEDVTSKKAEDATPTSTPAGTPAKATAAAGTSSTSSPATSAATNDTKKKNRRSFFGRLRDRLKEL